MAKSLTSNTIAQKSRRYGTEPINLLEIQFGGVTGTKYYSDREVTIEGNTYEAVVKDWGEIDFILRESATTNDLSITLVNTLSSPISNIFLTDSPESKIAIVYQWYVADTMTAADKTILFNGRITSPIRYSVDSVQLDIVNRILDLEAKVGLVVTKTNFPRSLPEHRGKIIPKVVGSVDNVPAVCIFTAGKSALRESLNESSLVVEVDDGSVFPTDAIFTLIIEDEQILMSPNTSGGNTLTATQRGYNGTTAVLHTLGTQMYEQSSQFRYAVFDGQHGVNAKAASISNVRVRGALLDSAAYTIDQDNYPGQILFSSYPQIDEEKETDFNEYQFDTIVDDGSTPFADSPESLTDDNNSNYSALKSGQIIKLQRVAGTDNTNQFKRAYLVVTYFTDKEEWEGSIQARAYWNNNNLGLLSDPTFDPVTEEGEEVDSASANQIINPSNPVAPIQYGGTEDMVQGPEASIVAERYSEVVDPTNLEIETAEFNPDAYRLILETVPDNKVPPELFTAYVDGLVGRVTGFKRPLVGLTPGTWASDLANFQWIDWVYSGFNFSPPTKGGTARITSIKVRYTDEFGPVTAASSPRQYRLMRAGESTLEIINTTFTGFKIVPVYVHEVGELYIVMRTLTYVYRRTSFSAGEFQAVTAELAGKIHGLHLDVEYELIKGEPGLGDDPVAETLPVVISKPVRKSHEVTKTFEITDYVGDWGDLLNKDAEIRFESDGDKLGTNLFVKDMHILAESGNYTFEYTDEITADVSGFYVDGTKIPTDYGIIGSLVNRPDQVFKLFLTWNSIFSLSDLDLSYYSIAADFYNAQYYRFDFAIVEEITLREVVEKMAFQIRTDQYWEAGQHRIKVLEASTAITKQITSSDIENMSIERSGIEEMVNLLEVRYSIDYSFLVDYTPNKFRDIITLENPGSQTDYGQRASHDKTFYLDFLRDDTTTSHVASYYLSYYSVIRRYLTMKCFLNQLELDKHDIIGVSFPLDNLANTPGRVLSNKYVMGGGTEIDQIELYVLMEDYVYYKLELTDSVSFSDAIQLTVAPLVSLVESVEFSDNIYFGFDSNLADTAVFSETLLYNIFRTLFIRDGHEGGWGSQLWGSSAWGGNSVSFSLTDELTIDRILALGTGLVTPGDAISILDSLVLQLVSRLYEADNDEFNSRFIIDDSLTIDLA